MFKFRKVLTLINHFIITHYHNLQTTGRFLVANELSFADHDDCYEFEC